MIVLKELDSVPPMPSSIFWARLSKKQNQVLQFMHHVARRVQFDDPQFPRIIIAWALTVPISGEIISLLLPDDYMLEDLRYVANLLMIASTVIWVYFQ